jgi:hypothetical protein
MRDLFKGDDRCCHLFLHYVLQEFYSLVQVFIRVNSWPVETITVI